MASPSAAALSTLLWSLMVTILSVLLLGEPQGVSASHRRNIHLHSQPASLQLVVDGRKPIAEVFDEFICATMDWWPDTKCNYGTCPWHNASLLNVDLDHPILQKAVQALAPLKIRLGGTLQDVIEYDVGYLLEPCLQLVANNSANFGFSGGCLPMQRWDELNQFFIKTGASVAFGLNALFGISNNGTWNPSNAAELIYYTRNHGYPVTAWELGNELLGDAAVGLQIDPQIYAENVKMLRTIVNRVYENDPVKPLVVAPDAFYSSGDPDYANFLAACGSNVVDVVTRHFYNLGPGVTSTDQLVANVLDPQTSQGEDGKYASMQALLGGYPWVKAWVGEAGGAYNSGHENVTDSFIMAFWYLDQLGLASKHNNQAWCRQTLIGGHYGLLDAISYVPNPDFYAALLWQELMGKGVLSVSGNSTDIRGYAHCQKNSTTGGVTVLILNYSNVTTYSVDLSVLGTHSNVSGGVGHLKGRLKGESHWRASLVSSDSERQWKFHMAPQGGDIHSRVVLLNGNPLKVTSDGDIPELKGEAVNGSSPVLMDPLTYAFVVLPNYSAAACVRS